jgi:reductive dehalogenase
MRIFSNRNRSFAAGPFPMEWLPRGSRPLGFRAPTSRPGSGVGDESFTHVLDAVHEVFVAERTADVAPARAPLPSPARAADNVKGYCYFLDADVVGIARLGPDQQSGESRPEHDTAVAIVVGHGRRVDHDEPGHAWIEGGEQAAAELRAIEVATVLARYLGTLGFAATAHSTLESDVDLDRIGVLAGALDVRNGRPAHPFNRDGYAIAVVTTELELPPDAPLARRTRWQQVSIGARHAVGWGGTRPGWRRLDGRHRPWHLGRYPMERVKRVDAPTTRVVPEQIQRPAARHNFFVRARAGDLGPRPQREVARFIPKAPHGRATEAMLAKLAALHRGDHAPRVARSTHDPDDNARAVKALGHFLGADMVGVCAAPDYAWYSHRPDGTPIEAAHRNAIVFVLDQGYETMEGASGDDWISGAQSMRAYLRASIISNTIAAHLRRLGHPAQAHSARDDEVIHLPLLLASGIGELSRIGELVLNPFVGPRFKSGVVTTDLPLTADRPIDFGLQDFCSKCTKCARECPCGAIRFDQKVMFNGYEMWKPDVDRCARYRITNMRGSACGRCMKTCPYNVEGVLSERPFQWAAMRLPFSRRWIAHLDDRLGRGSINPDKKWWVDIEMVDGVPVEPPKGANTRELQLDKKPRDADGYAMFPPGLAPPGDHGMTPYPVDREAGITAARAAERP